MMNIIVTLLLHSLSTPADVAALRATDHSLTIKRATEHIEAARFAGLVYGVDATQLLAIAWHESRYTNAVTREPGNRWSCGPLTPVPHRSRCTKNEISTLGGYLRGAEHLKFWMSHPRCRGGVRCGLTSYVGGGRLVYACAKFGRSINTFKHDACLAAPAMLSKAASLRRAFKGFSRNIVIR